MFSFFSYDFLQEHLNQDLFNCFNKANLVLKFIFLNTNLQKQLTTSKAYVKLSMKDSTNGQSLESELF